MKREFVYEVKLSIEEKANPDRADSQVQTLLVRFEGTVRKIILVAGGSRLKVDAVTNSSKSKEKADPSAEALKNSVRLFVEKFNR